MVIKIEIKIAILNIINLKSKNFLKKYFNNSILLSKVNSNIPDAIIMSCSAVNIKYINGEEIIQNVRNNKINFV